MTSIKIELFFEIFEIKLFCRLQNLGKKDRQDTSDDVFKALTDEQIAGKSFYLSFWVGLVTWKIPEKLESKEVHKTFFLAIYRIVLKSRDLYSKFLIKFGSILSSSLELDTDKSVPFQALFHFDFVDRGKRAECF